MQLELTSFSSVENLIHGGQTIMLLWLLLEFRGLRTRLKPIIEWWDSRVRQAMQGGTRWYDEKGKGKGVGQ